MESTKGRCFHPWYGEFFYDPLLCKVQGNSKLGYRSEVVIPTDLARSKKVSRSARHAILAYADDTVWIANNKEQMEEICKIADSFFKLNDIEINSTKSKLLVIKGRLSKSVAKSKEFVSFGKSIVEEEEANTAIKYLDVWLSSGMRKKPIIQKARATVNLAVKTLYGKKMSWSQLAYINNLCILPKVEYMLQAVGLDENILKSIHRPFLVMCKRKLGLAKNIPDWVISAKEMGGTKSLDEELMARQIRAFFIYLNRNDLVGEIVRNRVIQGCSRARLTRDIWLTPDLNKFKGLWKDNLACRTLVEAKRKGLNFTRREDLWRIHGEGATFAELLNEKELKKAVRSLQSLGLFYINQVISLDGTRLISWQMLKSGKKLEKRGRVTEWYKILQNRLIDNSNAGASLRAEYTARDPNSLSTFRQKDIFSRDKRRKEWFCWDSEEERFLGRMEVKGKKSFVMEHWHEKENSDPSLGLLSRCTGCKNSSSNVRNQSPNCRIRRKYKATGTVIPVSKVNATTWKLDVALDTCLQSKSVLNRYRNREYVLVNEIEIERWELELIRRAQLERNLEELLVDKLKRNIESKTTRLRYFTSSIVKANNRTKEVS